MQQLSLRDWRRSAGLTQRELARAARISRAAVSHVETGRYPPTAAFARRVCCALSEQLDTTLRPWELFPGEFKPLPGLEQQAGLAGLFD